MRTQVQCPNPCKKSGVVAHIGNPRDGKIGKGRQISGSSQASLGELQASEGPPPFVTKWKVPEEWTPSFLLTSVCTCIHTHAHNLLHILSQGFPNQSATVVFSSCPLSSIPSFRSAPDLVTICTVCIIDSGHMWLFKLSQKLKVQFLNVST